MQSINMNTNLLVTILNFEFIFKLTSQYIKTNKQITRNKPVKAIKSIIITIIGKVNNGLRPKASIKGTQKIVVTTFTKPVAAIAYCICSS